MGVERARSQLLVVDDDDAMRRLLRRQLDGEAHAISECGDLATARALLRKRRFDLVLLDLHLGGGASGLALFETPGLELPPTILLSGAGDDEAIRRAYELGAVDFLQKPVSGVVLKYRVLHALDARRMVRELESSRTRLAHAQRLARLGSFEIDLASGSVQFSEEARRIWGLPEGSQETSVEALAQIVAAPERDTWSDWLLRAATVGSGDPTEHRLVRFDQTERVVRMQVEKRTGAGGAKLLGVVHDVTERRNAEDELAYQARHDDLTGLGNRAQFLDGLQRAIAAAKECRRVVAVLFLDLDRFKDVNESLGHAAGDHLLVTVAARLRERLRASDVIARPARDAEPATPIARHGGDEFLVLIEGLTDPRDASKIARRMLDALEQPFLIGGREVYVTSSIGIAAWPDDDAEPENLLRCAEAAMYHSKQQGRARFAFYSPEMNRSADQRIELEARLHHALERNELEVWYQPRVRLADARVIGMEALLRWRHPELGLVSPGVFIPVAEKTGLILRLGRFVLREACEQTRRWHGQGFAGLKIAVNLSAEQFRDDELASTVVQVLADTWLPAPCLELELTETILMRDIERTSRVLKEIKSRGVQVAVDDFGIGYSSLNYLRSFPIDYLKIDRAFVRDLTTNAHDAAITAAIVAMAHSLHLGVVAEGIEEEAQVEFLRRERCDEVQGFLFGRPAPPAEITRMLEAQLVHPVAPAAPAAPAATAPIA